MKYSTSCLIVAAALGLWPSAATAGQGAPDVLGTVRIDAAVLVNGKPLPTATYELRLTDERPAPLPGQSPDAQRFVEFVADGSVVAREIAEVLFDADLPAEGASSRPVPDGTRVEMLRGGEFLRVSVKRGGERYLIHLPVAP